MTTIAVRHGIVAYDTRMTQNGLIHPQVFDKAFVSVKHQAVFAGCGEPGQILAMFRALEQAHALPWEDPMVDLSFASDWNEFEVIVAMKDGRHFFLEGDKFYGCVGEFHACGSGATAAIAAMHAGVGAVEAVKIAAKVDCHTGEPVKFVDLNWIPERPKMPNLASLDLAVDATALEQMAHQEIVKRSAPKKPAKPSTRKKGSHR